MKKQARKLLCILTVVLLSISLFGCNKKEVSTEEDNPVVANETFRTITIATVNGTATVKHKDGQSVAAYVGMNLYDGDDICVDDDSNIIIDADSDKHLLAEGGSHFWLSIEGTEDCTKTRINLDAGAVLCQIEEKLTDGESFDVTTASSTMCVRGTVFRVNAVKTTDNEALDVVEVYDGKVWSYIDEEIEEIETGTAEGQVVLEPGQCAVIKEATDDSEAAYVTSDQIDMKAWEDGESSIVLKEGVVGSGSAVLSIAYNKLPSVVVDQLVAIVDNGTELSLTKEELVKLNTEQVENKPVEQKTKEQIAQEALEKGITNETEFRGGALNDDICAEYGHSIITVNGVMQCSICGRQFNENYQKTEQDLRNEKAMEEQGFPMNVTLPEPFTSENKVTETIPNDDEEENKENNGSFSFSSSAGVIVSQQSDSE